MAYLPLSTANLPDPVIDPAQDASPEDYFNTVLWTGNGTTNAITGVGFQPDLTWIKKRSGATDHEIHDAVRGSAYDLRSNLTIAETDQSASFTGFASDGFNLAGTVSRYNENTATYVAWNWKANGSGVSNTDGSITSTVSANTTSGFSIVSFTGDGSSSSTVGHGLNQVPEFIIQKRRDTTNDWQVSFKDVGVGYLNYTDAFTTSGGSNGRLSYTGNTSTTYTWLAGSSTVNSVNASGGTYIAYCFHSVEGFSKFGSYIANTSNDGPFVYCGFRPAFVMIKRSDASGYEWTILDSKRTPYNVMNGYLVAQGSAAEATGYNQIDFLSNGFKMRQQYGNINDTGNHIYMAFAENPFKYSNAR